MRVPLTDAQRQLSTGWESPKQEDVNKLGIPGVGMTTFEWLHGSLLVVGFLGTWIFGAFKLGRAAEKMRGDVERELEQKEDKILLEIKKLEKKFDDDQKSQDHNFGEVGAAMRQYTADVERRLHEHEIYGRDNYVKIPDFKEALELFRSELKNGLAEIKRDISQLRN